MDSGKAMTTAGASGLDTIAREYLGKLLERHRLGASENDIRSACRDFLRQTGIAGDEREIVTETRPAPDSRHKVDLYLRNTYIEFKRSIMAGGVIDPEAIAQLDGYLLESAQAGLGIQNGILTDGRHYLKRTVGDHRRAVNPQAGHRIFDRPEQGLRLYEYLREIIDTDAAGLAPSPENLIAHFGQESAVFRTATALLAEAHRQNRDRPTIAVKRKLWRELLQVAIGQNSVDDSESHDWLYVRHTYLTALVGLMVQAHFQIDIARYAAADPANLLNGEILRQHTGLKGVTESDLFAWPLETGAPAYLGVIAQTVAKFNWEHNSDDLAATLYQNAIAADERKRMGEYYTPQWLARTITNELITDPADDKVLDPACGSGTFIAAAVRHIIANTPQLTPAEQLAKLQRNITGIDLHPVAVQLAKATWVIAAQDVIRKARQPGDTIAAPIHLGDSMQLRYDNSGLDAQGYITLDTRETLAGQSGPVEFRIPLTLARQTDKFDNLMMEISDAIENGDDTARILDRYSVTAPAERQPLEATIANMTALHQINRNHVWTYYLRNMTRPMVIAADKVDAIIGNPPWLTYSQSADIIREELKSLSQNRYQIWAGGSNAPHQDVATLFYCPVAELYLKAKGKIGMVLPHSVLQNGHHLKFRKAYYEAKRPRGSRAPKQAMSFDFTVKPPWNLDNLDPNDFFPIASCVVFAQMPGYRGEAKLHETAAKPLAPGQVEIWSGPTDTPQVKRTLAKLTHNDGTFNSPYATRANNGATIFDRRLFFVSVSPNENLFAPPDTYVTYPRMGTQDKKTYSVEELNGQIVSGDNLFRVYLGESLAPYVTLPSLTAALPASRAAMMIPLDHSRCPGWPNGGSIRHTACEVDAQELDPNMRARWEKMERLWEANRGKTDKKSLTQNLNWLNKLSSQLEYLRQLVNPINPAIPANRADAATAIGNATVVDAATPIDTTTANPTVTAIDAPTVIPAKAGIQTLDTADPANPVERPIRIAYTSSGRPTAALITDNQAILDYKLFQVTCRNLDEAYYLLAIINSDALAKAAKPFCTTNWAKEIRDLVKHLWMLPIPEYNGGNESHVHLSRLGRRAAQLAQYQLESLAARIGANRLTADRVRADLRNHWQPESQIAAQIETAAARLLTPP